MEYNSKDPNVMQKAVYWVAISMGLAGTSRTIPVRVPREDSGGQGEVPPEPQSEQEQEEPTEIIEYNNRKEYGGYFSILVMSPDTLDISLSFMAGDEYHGGHSKTDPQGELHKHNEYIKSLIPADQLLVYEMGEGRDRLSKFSGVPIPEQPFPHPLE
ncbi:hypothetical protein M422DRAFT_269899 [Sphaerobolus stellatus SS14]|uniref:Uncharacterized protein n=1 Tax=Sphaerobolus stellatus (strain SS14) TaxID=990650 RepID=A0A0C9U3I8_SPHS4|nr:hypothetical protein M422DRAFT_269899 [Sphaerobolus stellatus SS14]